MVEMTIPVVAIPVVEMTTQAEMIIPVAEMTIPVEMIPVETVDSKTVEMQTPEQVKNNREIK